MLEIQTAPTKMLDEIFSWVVSHFSANIWFDAEKEHTDLKLALQDTPNETVASRLVFLERILALVKNFSSSPVEYDGTISTRIPVNLDGWTEYFVSTSDLEKINLTYIDLFFMLKNEDPYQVKCFSDWVPHLRRIQLICKVGRDFNTVESFGKIQNHIEYQLRSMCATIVQEVEKSKFIKVGTDLTPSDIEVSKNVFKNTFGCSKDPIQEHYQGGNAVTIYDISEIWKEFLGNKKPSKDTVDFFKVNVQRKLLPKLPAMWRYHISGKKGKVHLVLAKMP